MVIVNVQEEKNIENALRTYKRKVQKIQQLKQLQERKEYTKPSVRRRKEILTAKFKENFGKS